MAFWKRKKVERVKEKVVAPEEFVSEAYVGEVVVEIFEREEGVFRDSTVELKDSEYVFKVVNKSSIPVFSTRVELQNVERTDLEPEIFIQSLGAAGSGEDVFKRRYSVGEHVPPINVFYEILYPENKGEVLWFEEENEVVLRIKVKSNMQVPIDRLQIEYIGGRDIIKMSHREPGMGQINNLGDRILWNIDGLAPNTEAICDLQLIIRPTDKEKTSLGKIIATVNLEKTTLSSISIKRATSRFLLNYRLRKNEKREESGKWEVYVDILNPYNLELKAEGEIEVVKGKIISMPKEQHFEAQSKKIIIDGAEIAPNSQISIGPIEIESLETPHLRVKVGGSVEEKVIVRAEGKYELILPDVEVAAIEIEKHIELKIDKALEKFVSENELPTLGKNKVSVESVVRNVGGASIGYIKLVDTIPIGLSDPEKISVKINNRAIRTHTYEVVDGGRIEKERNLVVKLEGDNILRPGSELKVTYTLKPQKIPLEIVQAEFPMTIYCASSPGKETYEKSLSADDIPTIKIRHIVRSVDVLKQVKPVGKDEFELCLNIENKGDDPILDYEIRQTIPKTFEILEVSLQADREENEKIILSWKITLEPRETKEIVVRVRGKEKYAIEDLMEVESI